MWADKYFENFNFYPNPASDLLQLSADQIIEAITISDLSGKIVLQEIIGLAKAEIAIDHLPVGYYVLNASINGVNQTFKLQVN